MIQDPFPDPGPSSGEPESSPLPPADDDGEGLAQGFYVCTPPEQLTLAGFAQNGEPDTMAPGPFLATVMHAVTGEDGQGLDGCSEDQLLGIISAARRQQSRDEWTLLAATAAYAARHAGSRAADNFAPVELGYELHSTPQSAAVEMDYATAVTTRLPALFAALGAGQIHPFQLKIIAEQTSILSDEDAAEADKILAGRVPGMTFGETRAASRKVVLKLDPEAIKKRKEAARGQADVRRFREDSGNGGMIARELPSDEVLASWQHVEQRALDLRAAGMPGSLQELRVQAYLDLLQERDSRDLPAPGGPGTAAPDQPPPDSGPPPADSGSGPDSPGGGNGGPGGPGGNGPGASGPGSGPSLAALVTITVPWSTYTGRSETPGQADGYGPLDGDDTRDLVAAAARHPRTRWCITALNPDGTAAAHTCLPGRHPPPRGTGPPGLTISMTPITRGSCDHAHGEVGYHPSRKLQHLIRARSSTCTAPGCCRPAVRCDLDHTTAWDQGGATCECNLAPLCRRHHRAKQAEGWHLDQPQPGVLVWHTPAGRRYATTPTVYQA
jgi:uncharacterized protein DUF222